MKKILLFVTLTLLVSCSFNQTFSNRESDRDDAEKISKKFYWELLQGTNKDKIYELFSDKFFEVTNKDQLDKLISDSQQEYGVIKENNLEHWETLVVKGSNSKSEYLLTYNVTRESGTTKETFSMLKEDENIKIVGYHINYILPDE